MKKIFFLLMSFILCLGPCTFSQNIGIGTHTPSFKLDVKTGSINTDSVYRIGGYPVLIISGLSNTFVGTRNNHSNNSGSNNTALGVGALHDNTSGTSNTAIGLGALSTNLTGNNNIAIGVGVLSIGTAGTGNIGIGNYALWRNTVDNNIGIGDNALRHNISGYDNTAIGHSALFSNNGSVNTATGSQALYNNQAGYGNTANGYGALFYNVNSYNTGIGAYTLYNTTNSQYNVAVGYSAGFLYNNGYNNVFVGANTDVGGGSGQYNVIAIGQGTIVYASSMARFGNPATSSYGGWAGWSNVSDRRFKKNIRENVPGLDFIIKLRPVTYQLDALRADAFMQISNKNKLSGDAREMHEKALREKEKITYTGFIAQEVEEAARQLGFDFSGVDAARNEKDTYGLRYAEFVIPLVKAVQEQQHIIQNLQKQIDELIKEIQLIRNNQ